MRRLSYMIILMLSAFFLCFTSLADAEINSNSADGEITNSAHITRQTKSVPKSHLVTPRHRKAREHAGRVRSSASRARTSVAFSRASGSSAREKVGKLEADYKAAMASYKATMVSRRICQQGAHPERCPIASTPQLARRAGKPTPVPKGRGGASKPAAPALAPVDVAYVALARLKLHAAKPMVGPSPSDNEWKMAAVGYPLWLWAEGNAHPAPVSDSVAGLYVSLEAKLSKVVFDMGDGSTVICHGTGTKWGPWVRPGQASPTCGHTYTKPSLPKGEYTITATTYWKVAWDVTGQTGEIPFVQSATTSIPVGELQVLVR